MDRDPQGSELGGEGEERGHRLDGGGGGMRL